MDKTGALGKLALGALAVYLAVWAYQETGWVGAAVMCAAAAGAYTVWLALLRRRREASFHKLIRFLLVKRLPRSREKSLADALSKDRPARAALVHRVGRLREAVETALSSTQRETAEAAMQSVRELHAQIQREHDTLISADLMAEIDSVVEEYETLFATRLYTNVAGELLEQAQNTPDERARRAYAQQAHEVVTEGLDNPASDHQALQPLHESIEELRRETGKDDEAILPQGG